MAEAELGKPEAESVRLLWCSKTRPDTFWLDRAAALAAAHAPGRFEMVETFTRENVPGARRGRVSPAMLAEVFDGAWQTGRGGTNESRRAEARFLSVGTKQMMRGLDAMLGEIGYPMPSHALLKK